MVVTHFSITMSQMTLIINMFFFFCSIMWYSMGDPSSLTRDGTHALCTVSAVLATGPPGKFQ